MPLSADEERVLIEKVQRDSDSEAWKELEKTHEGSIRRLASRFPEDLREDLYRAGVKGLLKAVSKFDSRRVRLWTYAYYQVKQHIIAEVCELRHISETARKNWGKIERTWERIAQEKQQEPTVEEVADARGLNPAVVREVLQFYAGRDILLLDDREDDEEGERTEGEVSKSPLPSPEEQVSSREEQVTSQKRLQIVLQILGSERGVKWLILCWLCEEYGHDEWRKNVWCSIVESLTNSPEHITREWPIVCADLPAAVPRNWSEVCRLFQTPPPALTADGLKQWYWRGRGEVRTRWPQGE